MDFFQICLRKNVFSERLKKTFSGLLNKLITNKKLRSGCRSPALEGFDKPTCCINNPVRCVSQQLMKILHCKGLFEIGVLQ